MGDRERVLALLHELEESDAEKGALLAELEALETGIAELRRGALGVEEFRARLPEERERQDRELSQAREEMTAAGTALAEAEEAVRRAKKDGVRDAQLFEIRARDRLSGAERRVAEGERAGKELERAAHAAERSAQELEAKARSLAKRLHSRPRIADEAGMDPPPNLAGLLEWTEGARAAVFVARGQVAAERDAVIRQANEVGSAALGEPLGSASVAVVGRRVEQALT